jgi:ribose transport system substrate-binding protein
MKTRSGWGLAVSLMIVGLLVAACGSTSNGTTTTAASGGLVTSSKQRVESLYRGTYEPPAAAPHPQAGRKILLLSCGQSVSTCAVGVDGARRAAQAMGWQTTVFDTKSDPNQAAAGIRQAIVAHEDGVFMYALDCRIMKQALREAQQAKLPVVAAESLDCDYGNSGAKPLFAGAVTYVEGDYERWIGEYGKAQAQYVIANTDRKAKVIIFAQDDLLGPVIQQNAEYAEFKRCTGCTVYPVTFTLADFSNGGLQQKAQQALLKHPDANAVIVQYDAVLQSGVSAAVQSSGRRMLVIAAEGAPATMDAVRSGKVTAGLGIPIAGEGFAGVDILNRLFHGQKQTHSGIGLELYDKAHNTPASGGWQPPGNFEGEYLKAWGVGK